MKVKIHNKQFIFSSEIARIRFFEEAEGKDAEIKIEKRPSREIRAFFEGCLVPVFFYSHPVSGWHSFGEARDVLKMQFLPSREVRRLDGSVFTSLSSLSTVSNERFKEFVTSVVEWMIENGVAPILVDSVAYARWRDTQVTEAIYPPLARLKKEYEETRV